MPLLTNLARSRRWTDNVEKPDASLQRAGASTASKAASVVSERVRQARKELLQSITDFALKHDLEVTSANLSAICNALSGANAPLAEAFAKREMSGEPIDQRWLEAVVKLDPDTNDRLAELDQLMDELEDSLFRFGQTAKSAADETNDQRTAMATQITAMTNSGSGAANVERVIVISRTMLDNIERVESAMVRSQSETEALRENLAKARMEADVDHLTRLPNRRAFERRLASEAQRAREAGQPLCVAFCDIDHFKAVNDMHGHDAGDRVLCAVASALNAAAGEDCFVSRHGGEEFVLLLCGYDKEAAFAKLDGVRRAIATKQFMNRETGKPFGKVTFSGGLAQVIDHADPRDALAEADAALYAAKQNGRNRIETSA